MSAPEKHTCDTPNYTDGPCQACAQDMQSAESPSPESAPQLAMRRCERTYKDFDDASDPVFIRCELEYGHPLVHRGQGWAWSNEACEPLPVPESAVVGKETPQHIKSFNYERRTSIRPLCPSCPACDEIVRKMADAALVAKEMPQKCPVCYYDQLGDPPENFTICPRCGTEFGYDDAGKTHAELRAAWIDGGSKWWSSARPAPVDSAHQLTDLEKQQREALNKRLGDRMKQTIDVYDIGIPHLSEQGPVDSAQKSYNRDWGTAETDLAKSAAKVDSAQKEPTKWPIIRSLKEAIQSRDSAQKEPPILPEWDKLTKFRCRCGRNLWIDGQIIATEFTPDSAAVRGEKGQDYWEAHKDEYEGFAEFNALGMLEVFRLMDSYWASQTPAPVGTTDECPQCFSVVRTQFNRQMPGEVGCDPKNHHDWHDAAPVGQGENHTAPTTNQQTNEDADVRPERFRDCAMESCTKPARYCKAHSLKAALHTASTPPKDVYEWRIEYYRTHAPNPRGPIIDEELWECMMLEAFAKHSAGLHTASTKEKS